MESNVLEELGEVDVCFVIDATGSMGPYIEDAKRHAKKIADEWADTGNLDIKIGIVEYRDHPPQDHTFITKSHQFSDSERFQNEILLVMPGGGGDHPEAVYDGLYEAANLQWRANSEHLCFLIGDAPPHGVSGLGMGDGFPTGCPCNLTARGIIEIFSMHNITLHACAIGGDTTTLREFKEMAEACRGQLFEIEVNNPEMVTTSFGVTMASTSGTISSSRSVWAAYASGAVDEYAVATMTGMSAEAVTASVNYLSSRGYTVSAGSALATSTLSEKVVDNKLDEFLSEDK